MSTTGIVAASNFPAATMPSTSPPSRGASTDSWTAHWPTVARSHFPPKAQYKLNPAWAVPAMQASHTNDRLKDSFFSGVTWLTLANG